jgi:single-stranded DNA-binding protein
MNTIIVPTGRIAGFPVFFPNAANPRQNSVIFTVLENDKISRQGQQPTVRTTRHSCIAWGKLADAVSAYCYPGKQVYIEGRTTSFPKQTGQVNPNTNKPVVITEVKVSLRRLILLGDSMKKLNERIAVNIAGMIQSGRLPQGFNITAEELLKSNNGPALPFDANRSALTGKHGVASVWTKDRGFWGPGKAGATVSNAAGAPPIPPEMAQMFEAFKANPKAMQDFFSGMAAAGKAAVESAPVEASQVGDFLAG